MQACFNVCTVETLWIKQLTCSSLICCQVFEANNLHQISRRWDHVGYLNLVVANNTRCNLQHLEHVKKWSQQFMYRILLIEPNHARVMSIIDGTEWYIPLEHQQQINISDLKKVQFSFQHAYIKSRFARKAKFNRYLPLKE